MVAEKQASPMLDALIAEIEARLAAKQQGGRIGYRQVTGNPTSNYMHGPGGIFGVSGLEQDVISTRVQPRGLAGMLPAIGSIRTNPLFPYLTGFLDTTGALPNGVCADCPTAGPAKSCIQTAQFGRYCFETKEIETNRVGLQTDRGEFLDLRIMNDPLLAAEGGILTQNINGTPDLRREVLMAFVEVGVAFQNLLMQQTYTGNPANNTGGGGYREFPGLDILIGTDKVDAITGTNCPSLDSDIKNFNFGRLDQFSASQDIVQVITYMYRILRHNASHMGFDPTTWAITMRPELFYELTAVWPCSYLTYRCVFRTTTGQERINVDAGDQIAMRDNMRQGSYLLIDGERLPVILDHGIPEDTNTTSALVPSGQFASDIYFIPLTVRGGRAVTYFEYLDYSQGVLTAIQDGRLMNSYWTDGGRFLWHKRPELAWCVQWMAKIEPRIILLTPMLAGRILNVRYAPLQHTRSPFPDDPYFVDGGLTSRAGPSLFSDWNLT